LLEIDCRIPLFTEEGVGVQANYLHRTRDDIAPDPDRNRSELSGMAATSNAPRSLAELQTLLIHDIKVKVAGKHRTH
jgi:hypothetical protein